MTSLSTNRQASETALEDITMPSLGADMTEGTLVQWLVKEGEQVQSGDIIAVLETQKGAIDMEVYSTGTIVKLLVAPIAKVPVGTVLARLALAESAIKEAKPEATMAVETAEQTVEVEERTPIYQQVKVTGIHASPIVRRLAQEQQLDLTKIKGSGPQGAILLNDLTPVLTNESLKSADKTEQSMRSAIAGAMEKSKQEIPHFYLNLTLDITNAQRWLQQHNEAISPEQHVLLLALLLKALATSLLKYPKLNGFYQDSGFEQASAIHIGNVISLRQGGLVVPAIHDVEKLSLTEVMQALRDITARSRNGHLRSSELTDATITVTNMGERGADSVFGVIYPPQVAILGFGRVREVVKLVHEKVITAQALTVTLSADHRVIDGMLAAKFLNHLAKKLQKPESL